MQGVEAEVAADQGVVVFWFRAVGAENPQFLGHRVVAGGDQSAVARRTQVFRREETKTTVAADGAGPAALVLRADRLGGVLDDRYPTPVGDGHDRVHLRALAVKMDRQDGLGVGSDSGLDFGGVDVVGLRVDIDEDRLGTEPGDPAGGGEERVGGGDHFVAGADPLGHQADQQGVAAGGNADRVRAAAILGQLGFTFGHGRPEDAHLRFQHGVYRRADFVADRGVLGLQIE